MHSRQEICCITCLSVNMRDNFLKAMPGSKKLQSEGIVFLAKKNCAKLQLSPGIITGFEDPRSNERINQERSRAAKTKTLYSRW